LECWQTFALKPPFFHIREDIAIIWHVEKGERPIKLMDCDNIGFTDGLWDLMQRGWASQPESRPPLSAFIEHVGK
jgi:hypothetical protein